MSRKQHLSKDSIMASAVAKQLKTYLDIERREESFDLTDPYLAGELKTSPLKPPLHNNFVWDTEHYITTPRNEALRHQICRMQSADRLNERESEARRCMDREMAQCTHPGVVSPYKNATKHMAVPQQRRLHRRRVASAGRIGGRNCAVRNTPQQRITSAERERIVNLTTRLLVATETIALPKNRNQSQECQTDSAVEENLHRLPVVKRLQSSRPKSAAYSDPGKFSSSSDQSSQLHRTKSAGYKSARRKKDKDTSSSEFDIRRQNNNYVVTRNNPLIRPNSSPSYPPANNFSDDSLSSDWSNGSRHKFFNHTNISTQTNQTRGTQTSRNSHLLEDSSLHRTFKSDIETSTQFSKHSKGEGMATQTRRKDMQVKVLTYKVYVVTGNKLAGGTKANIKINISGEHCDTGDRLLVKSKSGLTPFQRKQVDLFSLDSKYLGEIESVRIGHESSSLADGWFLEKVIIREGSNAPIAYTFQCDRWLSAKEDDGQTIRDLILTKKIPASELPSVTSPKKTSVHRRLSSSDESLVQPSSRNQTRKTSVTRTSPQVRPLKSPVKKTASPQQLQQKKHSPKQQNTRRSLPQKDVSSSDSESEIDKRKHEKEKRRERRQSKTDEGKPVSSFIGAVTTTNIPSPSRERKVNPLPRSMADSVRNVTKMQRIINSTKPSVKEESSDSSSVTSGSDEDRVANTKTPTTPMRPASVVSPMKEHVSTHKATPVPTKAGVPVPTKTGAVSPINGVSSPTKPSETIKSPFPVAPQQPLEQQAEKRSSIASVKNAPSSEDEKIEISRKDTTKKYVAEGEGGDFMAGFVAGIKANKVQDEERAKIEEEKEQFEEQLRNGSTIHEACEEGDMERVKQLISMVPQLRAKPDERGWCPVHIVAAFGHLDLVKWFSVSAGDLLTLTTPTGYTPIHLAAMNGHVNCIMILSAMGCAISSRTVDGHTPLHLAAMSNHIECVKWLLSNRAKVDVKDNAGRTPHDIAVEFEHQECSQLLHVLSRELKRKDSAMSLLRDSTALRKNSMVGLQSLDSGVGGESEEWLSDAEGTSDVKGRGGDERPMEARRTSVVSGRRSSMVNKQPTARRTGSVLQQARKLSRQEMRHDQQLEEKRMMYTEQRKKLQRKNSSFLDSIRQEIDGGVSDRNEEEF